MKEIPDWKLEQLNESLVIEEDYPEVELCIVCGGVLSPNRAIELEPETHQGCIEDGIKTGKVEICNNHKMPKIRWGTSEYECYVCHTS